MSLEVQTDGERVRVLLGDSTGLFAELTPAEARDAAAELEAKADEAEPEPEPESDFAGSPDRNQTDFSEFNGGGQPAVTELERVQNRDDPPYQPGESRAGQNAAQW